MLIFGSATPSGAGSSSVFVCQKSMLGQSGSMETALRVPADHYRFTRRMIQAKKLLCWFCHKCKFPQKFIYFRQVTVALNMIYLNYYYCSMLHHESVANTPRSQLDDVSPSWGPLMSCTGASMFTWAPAPHPCTSSCVRLSVVYSYLYCCFANLFNVF